MDSRPKTCHAIPSPSPYEGHGGGWAGVALRRGGGESESTEQGIERVEETGVRRRGGRGWRTEGTRCVRSVAQERIG
jgi:hypothetical protein